MRKINFLPVLIFLAIVSFLVYIDMNKENTIKETNKQFVLLQETLKVQHDLLVEQQFSIIALENKLELQNKELLKVQLELAKKQNKSPYVEVSRGGERKFIATAYTPKESGTITRTGTKVQEGRTVAVDPHVIPLGSKVFIESSFPGITGEYIAEDTGGVIKGNKIDIFLNSYDKAIDFGRREVKVRVLR